MLFDLLVLDGDFYAAMVNNDIKAIELIRSSKDVALPLIVIGELLGGFHHGNRFEKNSDGLKEFLAKPTCRVLMPSFETSEIYGKLYSELRESGKMIPTNDLWIAALVIEYEGVLGSFDKHFKSIDRLKLVA
ncbi:MAG TPA: type II toxin-antitoxin system VapC family toxin [Candidatus Saccharimonadales bacterium]|jgi:predicted nucleic acid-binding protein